MTAAPSDLRGAILNDRAKVELLKRRLALVAGRARRSLPAFFEFVMRAHPTLERVKVMPHQRVFLDFVSAHERAVGILPVGASKTFLTTGITLAMLGEDPTLRGAVVSATQTQAAKTVGMVSDYVRSSNELRLVYPDLRPSDRQRDPWTQTAITVARPPGIPDPSLVAVGIDGAISGARLNWIIVDDVLNEENTKTPEQREKVRSWLDSSVLSRLDPKGARVVVINSAWHPEDIVHHLEKAGWPTLRMDILGGVQVQDDLGTMAERERARLPWEPWTHPELRPASPDPNETYYRLRSHDPDPKNETPLWPERYPAEWIERKRDDYALAGGAAEFNRLYMSQCRDDASAFCKSDWVEECKANARAAGHHGFVRRYNGPNLVVAGVDLAFRKGRTADRTCIFVAECQLDLGVYVPGRQRVPMGRRRILEVQLGQWDAPEIAKRLVDLPTRYPRIVVRVEDNAAQIALTQMLRSFDVSLPIKTHTTGKNKSNVEYGVQAVFLDMQNGAWLIPCDPSGRCPPEIEEWIQGCLYYSPNLHTHDALMASWMAREQAREWGALNPAREGANGMSGSIGMQILAR